MTRFPIKQFLRFLIVGTINTAVDLAVLNALIIISKRGREGLLYAVFKAIAFTAAVINSYLTNRTWTFPRSADKRQVLEGGQFLFVSLVGAVLNVSSSWYVATFVPRVWKTQGYWPSVAALVGTGFSFALNFLGYKFWVFAPRPASARQPERAQAAA